MRQLSDNETKVLVWFITCATVSFMFAALQVASVWTHEPECVYDAYTQDIEVEHDGLEP